MLFEVVKVLNIDEFHQAKSESITIKILFYESLVKKLINK